MARQGRIHRLLRRGSGDEPDVTIDVPDLLFCGPMPPEPTGIASYDRAVLDGLERIGYGERRSMDVRSTLSPKDMLRLPSYRLGVLQVGNNIRFHLDPYRVASLMPSLVVLHDLALDDFVQNLHATADPLGFPALREAETLRGRITSTDIVRNEPLRVPWCAHVARRARGIIVHAEFCRRYLEEFGCRTPVFVVPHPQVESETAMKVAASRARKLRAPLEARGARTLIVAPGDINKAKCLDALVEATALLDDDVHVAIVGRRIEDYDLEPTLEAMGLGDRIQIHSDVSDADFLGWVTAADVIVDLRFPHRGEVSGSLTRAMQAGRPSIVSAVGSYLEVPDDAVLRVPAGPVDPAELVQRIRTLIDDPELRLRMGDAAAASMRYLRETDATARGYERAIEETLTLVRDPGHKALGGWAAALADMGVDEAMLGQGYGVEYARAMASFHGPARAAC